MDLGNGDAVRIAKPIMSKASTAISAFELEEALRDTVTAIFHSGHLTDLTVKRVRVKTEETLHLPADFFKQEDWKDKSKRIIEAAASDPPASETPASSPLISHDGSSVDAHGAKKDAHEATKGVHEAKKDVAKAKKDIHEAKKDTHEAKKGSTGKAGQKSDQKSLKRQKASKKVEKDGRASVAEPRSREPTSEAESDMSEVIDDDPKPKKRKPSRNEPESKGPATAKSKLAKQTAQQTAKPKSQPAHADPDLDEIKRLQGWLLKCGIRKMWFKELAPFEGPPAKIRHLKALLADVGLTGRYSAEKAHQIRETRELKADLEAVQDGARHWGAGEPDEDEPESRRPKSRLAKGFASLDFLGDEGEETD